MIPHRRLTGACIVIAAAGIGVGTVAGRCSRLDQVAPAIVLSLPVLVETLTAAIGAWLVFLFWPRREGRGLHCKKCGYYQERRGPLAAACPECGGAWLWIGMTRSGRRTGAPELVVLGVLLCLFALVGSTVQSVSPWVYLRMLPDRTLLAQIVALPDDSTIDLWIEAGRRKLPAAKLDAIAEALLKKKARDGYLSMPSEEVVFNAMMRPTAPPASVARYFASFLSAVVEAPRRVEAGREIAMTAAATFRGRRLTLGTLPRIVVISALYQDDKTVPIRTWTWEVDAESSQLQERAMDDRMTVDEPGTTRLRQEFWLAIGPAGSEPIPWENGVPAPANAGLSIKDHFEEVREVIVEPKPKKKPSVAPR